MTTRLASFTAAAAVLLTAAVCQAEDTVLRETTGPHRALLRSGVGILTVSHVPPLVVAATSDVYADVYLHAPVTGPWLDLSNRDSCRLRDCDNDERRGATPEPAEPSPTLSVRPAMLNRGYGLVAAGQF